MRADKLHTLKFLYSRQYRVTHADDSDDFAYQIAQREFQAKNLIGALRPSATAFPARARLTTAASLKNSAPPTHAPRTTGCRISCLRQHSPVLLLSSAPCLPA